MPTFYHLKTREKTQKNVSVMEPLSNDIRTICFLNGPFPASFFYFRFSSQLTAHKCSMQKFADDWIRTADLWCWKRPLYQLSYKHCPWDENITIEAFLYSCFIHIQVSQCNATSFFMQCTYFIKYVNTFK